MSIKNFDYESNPWLFNGRPLDLSDFKKYEAFVYLLIDKETGKKYIGRKYFYSLRKPKGSNRKKRTESDWKSYFSSSNLVKSLVEEYGTDRFERHILSLCLTRGDANYMEKKFQFICNVLESDNWYNDCIGSQRTVSKRILDARILSETTLIESSSLDHTYLSSQQQEQCQLELPFYR